MKRQSGQVRFSSVRTVTSLVDHLSGDLLGLLNQLVSAANELGRAIGPSRLAGDPAALRSAAAAWRRQHDEVRSIGSQLFSQVQDVLNGSWQGEASQAFAAQWQATSSQLEDFLASQLRVADSLEQAADRSAALNGQAVTLAHEIRALVSTLQSSGDPSVVIGMAGDGWDLLRRKDDLLHQTLSNWAA
jgi:WXG100 family type VII secretion target